MTMVFGNPGSTELAFFKHWPDDFRYILGLQEASVVAMADGYAQATRHAALVNLHSAVGVGHALGSIVTAFHNHTPLVITAGQQVRTLLPFEPLLIAQDAVAFPKPYVKWSCEPARAQDVPAALARAYYLAMQPPRGPTFVSIPADDWEVAVDAAEPAAARQVSDAFGPDPVALHEVAEALNRSERPALIVGPGVDRDAAWDLAVALAERTRSAVWVSPLSARASFPEDHPLFAGFLAPVRRRLAEQVAGYDVVVVLGAPVFTYLLPSDGPIVPEGMHLFQLIDDPEAAAWAPVGASILSSVRVGLAQLLEQVASSTRPAPAPRARRQAPLASTPMSAAFVLHTIAKLMPGTAAIVEEAPSHRNALHDHLPIRKPNCYYTTGSGGLGYSLPAAVGVALADPSRRVICLLGDGASLYSVQGLWTAVRQHLPITFVILNNQEYASLKAFSTIMETNDFCGVDLPGLNFAALATGFGCTSERVDQAEGLTEALSKAFGSNGPVLLDVVVDPAIDFPY
jgi:benzoylformate decarboxylase